MQPYQKRRSDAVGDVKAKFRALSDQFYRTPEHHKFVRQQVVNQLKSCPEIYDGYVPMAYHDYLNKDGQWGDHVTLQAASDSYGVKYWSITSFRDTCYIEILPTIQKSERGSLQLNLSCTRYHSR
ncbi:OVARIAN TUMOR DOMAIN-containing deubiquitinating enzyme 9 [Datura stramonium]|uniref:OVARIAN TUMOR DOMAIN-containing deubiquitinating enzyme 9 n=1 Tax=Datura stramonium TaxID=4076 RepID=A0ABS8RIR9_DATST|nr:OVARIAN TUMOR DOMAIN-containing deubiquitinating enzyme 9 [Datura stramonium]